MRHRMTALVGILLISSFSIVGTVSAHDRPMRRMKIRGVVERIEGRDCYVRTARGTEVRVLIGPESYWECNDWHLYPGQYVSVYGWYPEDRDDWFYAGTIAGPGFSFSLTNNYGVPFWVERREHERMAPTYTVYRDWYGPSYVYNPPERHMAAQRPPAKIEHEQHEQHKREERRGH
jgi:hypothetical protein